MKKLKAGWVEGSVQEFLSLSDADMEKGDPTVSVDLLLQALFRLGFSRKELARAI